MFRRQRGGAGGPGDPGAGGVHVSVRGATTTLAVHGCLDGPTGARLVDTTRSVLSDGPDRLHVDLRQVADYTADGAAALLACRELGAGLPGGVHYRTDGGAGSEALLVAYGGGHGPVPETGL